jgi:hypothetical protein
MPSVDGKKGIKKKTHNNIVSVIRCAFEYGYRDYPEKHNPASALLGPDVGHICTQSVIRVLRPPLCCRTIRWISLKRPRVLS